MTRPREPIAADAVELVAEGAIEPVDAQPVRIDSHQDAAQLAFAQRAGARIDRRKRARASEKLVTVTDLLELQEIKASKAYRGMQLLIDGKLVTCHRWEDYCLHVEARSRVQVDEDLRNIAAFGADFMEAAQEIGLGYRQLRDMRQVHADQHPQLIEAAKRGDEGAVLDLIDQHSRETEKLKKELADRDLTLTVRQKMIDEGNAEKTRLLDKLAAKGKFKPSAQAVAKTAEEQVKLDALYGACLAVDAGVQSLAVVVREVLGDAPTKVMSTATRAAVEALFQRIARTAEEHSLPVDFKEMVKPAWLDTDALKCVESK